MYNPPTDSHYSGHWDDTSPTVLSLDYLTALIHYLVRTIYFVLSLFEGILRHPLLLYSTLVRMRARGRHTSIRMHTSTTSIHVRVTTNSSSNWQYVPKGGGNKLTFLLSD